MHPLVMPRPVSRCGINSNFPFTLPSCNHGFDRVESREVPCESSQDLQTKGVGHDS